MSGAAGGLAVVRRVEDLRATVARWRRAGDGVGLAPTMGALHEGHLALLDVARGRLREDGFSRARVVATIFVNPKQFGEGEDFQAYPRDEAADLAKLAAAGCDLVFIPAVAEMYPQGFATAVRLDGPLTSVMEGAARPGHFDGVGLVVAKLLLQAGADRAVFGEKDWQQLAVIRRVAADLDIPTRIDAAPTARAVDGLALSSRNRYLTVAEREVAPTLYRAIAEAAERIAAGAAPAVVCSDASARIEAAGFARPDYVEARDAETLDALGTPRPRRAARVFAAARLGRARLIDNTPIPGWREEEGGR